MEQQNNLHINLDDRYGMFGDYINFHPSIESELVAGDVIVNNSIELRYIDKGKYAIYGNARDFVTGYNLLKDGFKKLQTAPPNFGNYTWAFSEIKKGNNIFENKTTNMEFTNKDIQGLRIEALHASLKIESMYPYSPVAINMEALPIKEKDFNIDNWLNSHASRDIRIQQLEDKPTVMCMATDIVLERANKILDWLIKG